MMCWLRDLLCIRKYCIFIIFLFCLQNSWGQDLIINNDFSINAYNNGSPITPVWRDGFNTTYPAYVKNWFSPKDSTDFAGGFYYGWHCHLSQQPYLVNRGAKPGYYPFPMPHKGIGYAQVSLKKGLIGRSFISQLLTDTLQAGQEYCVEFYTRPFLFSVFLSNNIGVYFSADTLDYYAYTTGITPHVEASQIITDTTKWTRVKGSFVAQGNEHFINLGNFRHDTASTMVLSNFNIHWWFVYNIPTYLIDAVSVYKPTDTLYTVTLPKDTLLCPGETLDLVAVLDSGFKLQDTVTTYLWSTGSTDSNITVTQPGSYWVQTTINKRWVQTDTIVVSYFDANYTLDLPDSVGFCENETANIVANNIPLTKYYWSNGDTTWGISIGYPTTLQLTAVTPCYTLQESVTVYQKQCETYIYIPNAFTPDGDGKNDFFEFFGVPEPLTLIVFNRWGGIVYQNPNYQNNWDGTNNGEPLPAGVYSYLIEYLYVNPKATQPNPVGSKQQIRGTVTIVR